MPSIPTHVDAEDPMIGLLRKAVVAIAPRCKLEVEWMSAMRSLGLKMTSPEGMIATYAVDPNDLTPYDGREVAKAVITKMVEMMDAAKTKRHVFHGVDGSTSIVKEKLQMDEPSYEAARSKAEALKSHGLPYQKVPEPAPEVASSTTANPDWGLF